MHVAAERQGADRRFRVSLVRGLGNLGRNMNDRRVVDVCLRKKQCALWLGLGRLQPSEMLEAVIEVVAVEDGRAS